MKLTKSAVECQNGGKTERRGRGGKSGKGTKTSGKTRCSTDKIRKGEGRGHGKMSHGCRKKEKQVSLIKGENRTGKTERRKCKVGEEKVAEEIMGRRGDKT